MDNFITVYFTSDYNPSDSEVSYFERAIGCEIGIGHGYLNIYTKDKAKAQALIDLIGDFYISEVSYE